MLQIDLNADLGEGFPFDAAIIPHLTSANISCGAHAGDETTIRNALRHCAKHAVAVGAHPAYPDPKHFGRQVMTMPLAALKVSLLAQLAQLQFWADAEQVKLRYIKPHGALYNKAAKNQGLAEFLAQSCAEFNPELPLMTLPDSALANAAKAIGLKVITEAFADRAYQANGQLVSRQQAGALLNTAQAIAQSVRLVTQQQVQTIDGITRPLAVASICLHGDSPQALQLAIELRQALLAQGVQLIAATGI